MNSRPGFIAAGLSHRDPAGGGDRERASLPAIAIWPAAPRGWPARLRDRLGLVPGERVAIVAKNSPAYLELLYGIWHAGLAAVPANAKLHGAELGYILEHSGARVCFASPGLDARDRAACAEKPRTPDRHRRRRLRSAVRRRRDRPGAARRRRSRLAVLHLGHHRAAERRHAHASLADRGEPRLWRRGRSRHARRCHPACRADEPRLRPLHHAACGAARPAGDAGDRRLRAGGSDRPVQSLAAHCPCSRRRP